MCFFWLLCLIEFWVESGVDGCVEEVFMWEKGVKFVLLVCVGGDMVCLVVK